MKKLYRYRAKVIKVIDGDTIDFAVDLGFNVWLNIRTRLANINAPEMGTPGGAPAKGFVIECLPVGAVVMIETLKHPTDKYGRWLATVFLNGETTLNYSMLMAGHAVPYAAKAKPE